MNLQDRDVELNWREVTCKRSVQDESFPRGIQDFDFSVSGKNAFIPSLSYFVIDTTLTVKPTKVPAFSEGGVLVAPSPALVALLPVDTLTASRRPAVADGIALADHFGSCLYNNAFFRAGNSDVSLITQYIPQAGVLKSRLDKSNAWSRSIGRIVMQDDADFERRRQYVSIDGQFHDDGLKPKQYTERPQYTTEGVTPPTAGERAGQRWDYTALQGTLVFNMVQSANRVNLYTTGVQVGDIIQFGVNANLSLNSYFQITGLVINGGLDATFTVNTNFNFAYLATPVRGTQNTDSNTPVAGAWKCWAPHDPACGFNQTQVMFQPPLGIFSEANPISGGDFKISLNPSPSYKVNGVQSLRDLMPYQSPQLTGDYNLVINDVKFYVCTIKSDVSPTGVIPLSLVEMAVLNKTMNQSGTTQNLDFTVPPSTMAITVFIQGANASTTTCIPGTKFYAQTDGGAINTVAAPSNNINGIYNALVDNVANKITRIQVTYGSVTKTQTLYESGFSSQDGLNKNIQRFLQSIQYSGRITSDGGSESHPQYLERAGYYHFDFSKDKNDTSSYVNVQIGFANDVGPGQNLFIVAHYARQAEISYENGYITQVISVNR